MLLGWRWLYKAGHSKLVLPMPQREENQPFLCQGSPALPLLHLIKGFVRFVTGDRARARLELGTEIDGLLVQEEDEGGVMERDVGFRALRMLARTLLVFLNRLQC